jgi:hypothetical protein
MMKILKVVCALLLALALGGFALVWYVGAWNILFPSSRHDTVPPTLPAELESPAVLLFSKTNGFRHKEGIPGGNRVLTQIARNRGWGVYATENGAIFNENDLQRFDVVVFQNASGDMLSVEQERAFQRWLESGGGWLGTHAAGDGSHSDWPWYVENLLGAEFTAHILDPQFQVATVLMEGEHPVNRGVPNAWNHEEEWYSWRASPRGQGFTILATVDEGSYTPVQKFFNRENDLRMGDHPVVWSNCIGLGRSVYAAMGHKAEAFDNPHYRGLLENALAWLMGLEESGC